MSGPFQERDTPHMVFPLLLRSCPRSAGNSFPLPPSGNVLQHPSPSPSFIVYLGSKSCTPKWHPQQGGGWGRRGNSRPPTLRSPGAWRRRVQSPGHREPDSPTWFRTPTRGRDSPAGSSSGGTSLQEHQSISQGEPFKLMRVRKEHFHICKEPVLLQRAPLFCLECCISSWAPRACWHQNERRLCPGLPPGSRASP